MKIVLILSLALNIVLVFSLFREKETPPLERFQLETALGRGKRLELPRLSSIKIPEKSQEQKNREKREQIEVLSKKIIRDRLDFLSYELGLDQHQIDQIELIKESFVSKFISVASPSSHGHLTQAQRSKLLKIEKERDKEMIKLIGQEKWDKFQSFKKYYNKNLNQQFSRDSGVVVPLDI